MENTHELVEKYIPLANKLAFQKKRNLPFVDIDELRSAAYMGLVEAASRFKPDLGVAFGTFAYPRIFGAIQDYLRELGWGKRGDTKSVVSLDVSTSDEETCMKDTLEAKTESDSGEAFELIVLDLDKQAQKVLHYYFIDEYSMKEVGQRFGVSESRVSQLINRYKSQIRQRWEEQDLRVELAA